MRPPLIVVTTCNRSVTFASGLPSTSTRSACLPTSSVPNTSCFSVERAAPCPMIFVMSSGEKTRLSARSSSASDCFGGHVVSVP